MNVLDCQLYGTLESPGRHKPGNIGEGTDLTEKEDIL